MAKSKDKRAGGDGESAIRLAEHPRAQHHIRLAKGWGGIIGFALTAWLSWKAGVPSFEVGVRALAGGVAGHLIGWACAVQVWRHIAVAEYRAAVDALRRRYEPPEEEAPETAGAA
jgi:hypothetical protein